MKIKLMDLWEWLNDKKTNIGMAVMLTAQAIQIFTPNLMPSEQTEFLQTLGALIGGFGLMHKGVKNHILQKLQQTLFQIKQKKK